MNTILIGVLGYVVLQLVVGLLVSRRIANEEDYLLAGRRLGSGLATFSFFATWFGAETCISSAGKVYENGLSGISAEPFGYGGCLLLMGFVIAAPLWRRKFFTLADLFRERYSVGVERMAVLLMVPTSVLWAAAQIRGFGQVLDVSSGFGTTAAITTAAGVAILYTAFGGMRADVVTDLLQGIVIIAGLVVISFSMLPHAADLSKAWQSMDPSRLALFPADGSWIETIDSWAIPVLGSIVAQELASRALACRSPEIARRSALFGGGMYIAVGLIPVALGFFAATTMPGIKEPEQILTLLAKDKLSPFLFILFAGALVSAILSTVDSTLLAASSLVSHNILIPIMPGISERNKVRLSRSGVVLFGIAAWFLALQADSIYELVENASSFGSAGLVVILGFGLFTRFGGVKSAFAALLAGVAVSFIGIAKDWPGEFLTSLAAALVAYAVVGWWKKAPAPG